MMEFTTLQWVVVGLCAAMVGFSKTGIPGLGILVVPLLANVMDARASVGFLLPMLCVADVIAVLYWRRHVDWPKLLRLLPWAMVGVVIGHWGLGQISSEGLMPLMGALVLGLIGVTTWRNSRKGKNTAIPTYWWFAAALGLLAGVATMMANAAGPIMAVYLLAMRLKKEEFLGTGAMYCWIVNLFKVPFSQSLGLITATTVATNAALLPCIVAGGLLGILLVRRINDRVFTAAVTVLATAAAVGLVVRGLA